MRNQSIALRSSNDSVYERMLCKINTTFDQVFLIDEFVEFKSGIKKRNTITPRMARLVEEGHLIRQGDGVFSKPRCNVVMIKTHPKIQSFKRSIQNRIKARIEASTKSCFSSDEFLDIAFKASVEESLRTLVKQKFLAKKGSTYIKAEAIMALPVATKEKLVTEDMVAFINDEVKKSEQALFFMNEFEAYVGLICTKTTLDNAVKRIVSDGYLVEISKGIYCKSRPSDDGGEILHPEGFRGVVSEALTHLGVEWREPPYKRLYENLPADVPIDVVLHVKQSIVRQFSYRGASFKAIKTYW